MAYTKKTWVSGETPLSAENMNHIEQGVADAHNDISSLNTKITKIYGSTLLITFENGESTIDLKDASGNSYKPNALIITPQSQAGFIQYHWDYSSVGALFLKGFDQNGVAYNGTVRIGYIALTSQLNA